MLVRTTLVGFATVLLLAAGAPAQERGLDPWLHEQWHDATFGDLLDAMQADVEAPAAGERHAPHADRLWRWRMTGLESAQYSLAEDALRRGDVQAAIDLLAKVAAATASRDLRDVTHYNLAEVARLRLRDADAARKHYARVAGSLRHLAHRRTLGMLIGLGQVDAAAASAHKRIAATTNRGARLAMLHALARAWTRHGMPDRARGVYQRIAREFTPKDIQEIVAAIEKEAADTVRRLMKLIDLGQDEDVLWEKMVERRLWELGAAGRWDEYDAFWNAAVDTWNKLLDEEDGPDTEPRRRLLPRKA